MFHQKYPLSDLRPAPYNPRRISPAAIEELQASLQALGPIKAIIARNDRTIVAGHQRTKAMLAVDITHAPVYVLSGISDVDEVRFNQIHNSADIEIGGCRVAIRKMLEPGWTVVDPQDIEVITKTDRASQLGEILKLLAKHGEWGNAVADTTGRILASPLYAYACHQLKRPLRVAVVPREKGVAVLRFLGKKYGEFSYSHLPEQMWAQTFAQMNRLRDTGNVRTIPSRTYENAVIPRIKKTDRILDFGAGQMDYVKRLRKEGYDIHGVEFYLRKSGINVLDTRAVHRHIDQLCKSLRERGRYDVVICDSVVNSVTSVRAEEAVLGTVNALCRPSGLIVFSGRSRSHFDRLSGRRRSNSGDNRHVWFLDSDGITAMYQRGVWLFQKAHTLAQVRALASRFIGQKFQVVDHDGLLKKEIRSSSWAVFGTKSIEVVRDEALSALAFEFDLPLPNGKSYGRASDICAAWEESLKLELAKV
ncbi:MAG TPA: ParB N-terminal domain-containing protein [Pirellulaceae bacterium]|nr:ParB N-terminal domain-containing protein [Pirellulaceae bacterium]